MFFDSDFNSWGHVQAKHVGGCFAYKPIQDSIKAWHVNVKLLLLSYVCLGLPVASMWYHLQERAGACALHTSCCEASCTFGGLDLGLFIVTFLVAAIQLVSLKVKKGRAGQKDNGAQRFCGRKVFKSYGTIRRVPNCLVVCFSGLPSVWMWFEQGCFSASYTSCDDVSKRGISVGPLFNIVETPPWCWIKSAKPASLGLCEPDSSQPELPPNLQSEGRRARAILECECSRMV